MLSLSTIQILATLAIDHSLYWLLAQIRYHGRKIKPISSSNTIHFNVHGSGILAEMFQGMGNAMNPMTKSYAIDTVACLPNPIEPNYELYQKICSIIGIVWVLLLLEPYGLRIRQKILEYYYPKRAEERAIWLYNEIMNKRRLFVKMARRKARKKYLKDKAGTHGYNMRIIETWKKILKFFSLIKYKCKLCGDTFTNYSMLTDCIQSKCNGRYCFDCFDQLKGTCPLCMDPVTYGDMSDYSAEWGSTDEEDFHTQPHILLP
uniref:CSON004910 protein n=1 Tax=Culicoides sonorensis TaxID=179676 RepID=A0A336MS37_CULSO